MEGTSIVKFKEKIKCFLKNRNNIENVCYWTSRHILLRNYEFAVKRQLAKKIWMAKMEKHQI